jgi:hypothetical protein
MSEDSSNGQHKRGADLYVIEGPRVIRACHTCKHEDRQNSDDRDDFWCLASGKPLEETLESESWCGSEYAWWEPISPQQQKQSTASAPGARAPERGRLRARVSKPIKLLQYGHPRQATIDHRTPLTRGGTWALDNLVIACERCNGEKADMPYDTYVEFRHKLLRGEDRAALLAAIKALDAPTVTRIR